MKVLQIDTEGNPNIGLYGFVTDHFCLLGSVFSKKQIEQIGEVLQVPCYQVKVARSTLVGALVNGNNTCLLLPNTIEDEEKDLLQGILDETNEKNGLSMKLFVVPSKLTALGNNILCNDHGALVNPDYSAVVKKQIRQELNVTLHPGLIDDTEVVGSCGVYNSRGVVIHHKATPEQVQEVESLLGVPVTLGTANIGSGFIRSAVLCNDNGMIVGRSLTGIEVENIFDGLGFLEDE
jgi:translation initiation factor 6